MKKSPMEDARLARLSTICLALPEAIREPCGETHATFIVREKKFAYFLSDHHGDGRVAVCVRAHPGQNTFHAESDPAHFYLPAYIGPRGWLAVRLDVPDVDWSEVADFVTESYRLAAPKRLAAQVASPKP